MNNYYRLLLVSIFCCSFFAPFAGRAQRCDCVKAFQEAKSVIEKNYAGFSDKVHVSNKSDYKSLISQIEKEIRNVKEASYCAYFIQKWFAFFKDGHIQLTWDRGNPLSVEQQKKLEKEYMGELLSEKKIEQLRKSKTIEGIYWNVDSLYSIAIVKNPNAFGTYVGLVLTSSDSLWKPGKIILELKQESKGSIKGLSYARHVLPKRVTWEIGENHISDWIRDGTFVQYREKAPNKHVSSRVMSDKTFTLR